MPHESGRPRTLRVMSDDLDPEAAVDEWLARYPDWHLDARLEALQAAADSGFCLVDLEVGYGWNINP